MPCEVVQIRLNDDSGSFWPYNFTATECCDTWVDTCRLDTKKEILALLLSQGTFALDFTESRISAKVKSSLETFLF